MRAASWLNGCVGVVGVLCLLAAQKMQDGRDGDAGEEVVLRRIVIEDEDGKRRAELGVGEGGAMLTFFDTEGEDELLAIGSGFGTPTLTLLGDPMGADGERPPRISMGAAGPDTAIFVHDPAGGPRVQVGYTNGKPNVILIDERMRPIWRAVTAEGEPGRRSTGTDSGESDDQHP